MRKLNQQTKDHLCSRAKRLQERKLSWKAWRKSKRQMPRGKRVVVFRDGVRYRARAVLGVPLPRDFCLTGNSEKTLEFLSEMRRSLLRKAVARSLDKKPRNNRRSPPRIGRYFDFTTLDNVGPSAALVLASLYQRVKSIAGVKLNTIDEHLWNPAVTSHLRSIGFHDLLEMRPLSGPERAENGLRIQKFVTGQNADGSKPGALQEALANLLPEHLRERLLTAEPYGGMLEAILNSYSWAYPKGHVWEFPVLSNWWLTGAVDTRTNQVTVCVFDQGISIPVSLPGWTHWNSFEIRGKKIIERLKLSYPIDHSSNDGLAIRLAMTISKSNTNLPQHGKGLHTMIEVAERARHGRLRIMSRNGEYVWETGTKPKSFTHKHALDGTLVEWQLQL